MNKMLRAALALTTGAVAMQGALASSAQVAVNGNTVTVSPSTLVLATGDRTAVYSLATRGYAIVSMSVPGMSCSVAGDSMSATCRRDDAVKGRLDASLVVRPANGAALPAPNIFIQAN
jgi:hypothetical protein